MPHPYSLCESPCALGPCVGFILLSVGFSEDQWGASFSLAGFKSSKKLKNVGHGGYAWINLNLGLIKHLIDGTWIGKSQPSLMLSPL